MRPAAFTAPLPRDPVQATAVPSRDDVLRILIELTDPKVPDRTKNTLVQGGVKSGERRAFTRDRLDQAARHGELPLTFTVGNIWPVGTDTAAAQVDLAGPKLAPTSEVFTFLHQGGWLLSSDSAATLIDTVAPD